MDKRRELWLDIGKGICMIQIMMFHAENKYIGHNSLWISFIQPWHVLVSVFFFLSGYLYSSTEIVDVKRKLEQIIRGIIIPYIIFTSVIYIPKMIKYGVDISWCDYFIEIFLGQASWFVMALTVGQISVLTMTKLKPKYIVLIGVLFYIASCFLRPIIKFQPWYFVEGF